ncbi:MAG: phage tail tape measure protein [Corynebacterium sp.]|uniref:phage tail tape measure protein n=1 Tax=Corynebacterium sp. TaxID=1720 RepID=UPI003EFE5493
MSGVWVPVLASMKGFIAEVNKGAGQAAKSAGSQLEKGLSDAGKAGGQSAAESMAKAMGNASSKVAAARSKEAGAAAELRVAEEQLAQVRDDSNASAGQIMAAESKVEDARRRQQSMSERLGAAEKDLQAVRDGGQARASSIVTAENRVEDARLKSQKAAADVAVAEQKAQDARAAAQSASSRVTAAEQAVTAAREASGEGSRDAVKAERDLARARKDADKTTVSVKKAEGDVSKTRAQSETASEQLEVAELGLVAAQDKAARSAREVSEEVRGMEDSASSAGGSIDGLVGKIGGIAGAAAGIAGVGATFAAGFDVSKEIGLMNRQLGLTGETAASLGDEVGEVMRSGIAGSADVAAGAVGSLSSQFRYLGFEGEQTAAELADNFIGFSETFGVSMEEATQTAGQLVVNGLAGDVEAAADMMTTAMQRVPAAMRDEMPEIINEYGTNFRALGFSGEEAFSMLVSQADKGKWALDKTGDALKEFTIRASDGSKATSDAYAAIGEDAEAMATSVAAGGDSARLALQYTAESLMDIEDPAERAQHAIALFGTPLEDLSVDQIPQFLDALTQGEDRMGGFAGSSQELADSVSDSLQGRLNALKGTVLDLAGDGFMKLWDAGQKVADWAGKNGAWLGPLAAGLGTLAGSVMLAAGAIKTWNAVMALYKTATAIATGDTLLFNMALKTNVIILVVSAVAALVAGLVVFFTKTETGKQIWQSFMDALSTAWTWLKDVFTPVFSWLGDVISSVWSGIKTGWDILWQGIQTAWTSVLKPTFDTLWTIVSTTLGIIGTVILAPLLIAWNLLSAGIQAGWNNLIKPAWDMLAAGAQWLWSSVLQPIFGFISAGWSALTDGIAWYWNNVTKPAWAALQAAAQWMWSNVLSPVFGFIEAGWEALSNGIRAAYDSIIKPAWDAVGNALRALWDNVVSPVVTWIKDKWDDMGTGIRIVYDSVISPAFDALKNGLSRVKDFFGSVVDGIKGVWDRLRGILAKPINFMIGTVYNGGILKAWNTIAKFIPGLNEASELGTIPEHATGGRISGPGTGTSDDVLMWGSNGEHMWTEAEVQKAGGHGAIYAMREMIADGDAFTFDGHGGLVGLPNRTDNDAGDLAGAAPGLFLPAFARGGEIRPGWEDAVARGHEYAKKVAPGPYVFGGSSGGAPGGGTDCSGFMSEIADVILGGPGGQRKWATGSFPGPQQGAWESGLGQGFSVGIINGGPGGGHTAGTLSAAGNFSDVNVESGGGTGQGATYGGAAVGADSGQFTEQHHLKIGADGEFVSGGGGGPSPAEKKGSLRDKVKGIFDDLLEPIKAVFASAIGEPPPEWLAIPPKAMTSTKDKTIDFLFDRIEDLGNLVGKTYDAAKGMGSKMFEWGKSGAGWVGDKVGGLFRDRGGWIPDGLSIVRNETGRPEAVLNWDQVKAVERMIDSFGLGYNPVTEAESILRSATEGGSTPQEAVQGGTQVAQHVFASEMGDKSALEIGADALFDFFGMGDSLTKKLTMTPAKDLAPLPEWYGKDQANDAATVTTGAVTAEDIEVTAAVDPESEVVSAASVAAAPVDDTEYVTLVEDLDTVDPNRHKTPEWGMDFFVHEIVRQAQDKGLPASGAKIGVATSLVEVGDPMKMYASHAVPDSLNYRHDAIGSDNDSIGLFQQRNNGAWGTTADRMDPYRSAGMFFDAMLSKFPNWASMDPGAVAQGVQVSAFPDKYGQVMGRAEQLVLDAGLYDTGGTLPDGALAVNLSGSPEHVFTDQAMQDFVESSQLLADAAADLSEYAAPSEPVIAAPAVDAPTLDTSDDSAGSVTLVINLDGEQVLEKRVDAVEGRVEVNEKDIRAMKTERRAVDTATRVLLA